MSRIALPVFMAGFVLLLASGRLPAQPREGNQNPAEGAANASAEQSGPPVEAGRILEIETKGKLTTLKIESALGETYDVKLTPQINFFITGAGDTGFIQPGAYIEGRGTKSNEPVFLQKVTVYLLPKGKRPPAGKVQKASAADGESLNIYDVSGVVNTVGPADGYPEYTAIGLKVAGRAPPVWLEPTCQIEVASADPEHTAVGADLEMAMKVLRGGKKMPVAIRIRRETPFSSGQSSEGEGASPEAAPQQ